MPRPASPSSLTDAQPERTTEVTKKREALEELIRSDGWQYFVAHVRREWQGIGFVNRMGAALQTKDPTDPQVVYKSSLEILRLLEWPANQVRELMGDADNE